VGQSGHGGTSGKGPPMVRRFRRPVNAGESGMSA